MNHKMNKLTALYMLTVALFIIAIVGHTGDNGWDF